jgi:hypothetical protein
MILPDAAEAPSCYRRNLDPLQPSRHRVYPGGLQAFALLLVELEERPAMKG